MAVKLWEVNKLTGKEKAHKLYKKYDGDNNVCYINLDAIDMLPDIFDVIPCEVFYDPKKLDEKFSNVGSEKKPKWFPNVDFMYDIGKAIGYNGEKEGKTINRIWEEVDINPLKVLPITEEANFRKLQTAVEVSFRGYVLECDGTYRYSSPRTGDFNYWNRAKAEWAQEEAYTDFYKHPDKYKNPFKYDTYIKRYQRYLALEKFAVSQAETRAASKVIRELAGMKTGYDPKDLKKGVFVFYKVVKSGLILKAETAARIESLRKGHTKEIQQTSNQLFGQQQIDAPIGGDFDSQNFDTENNQEKTKNPFDDIPTISPIAPPVDEKTELKNLIQQYYNENFKIIDKVPNAKDFVLEIVSNYKNEKTETLKDTIKRIEAIKDIKIIDHKLNLGKDVF